MISVRESPFRAFSARRLIRVLPQGFALGYYISRPWRSGLKFSHRLGSDRMPALNPRSDVSFAWVESMIRSLPLSVLYRVAIEFIFSFKRLIFHTASNARGSVPVARLRGLD